MAKLQNGGPGGLVVVGQEGGRALIGTGSPLTRLNYFDGKLLRAEDLRVEQSYLRKLAQLSNQAGGRGPVHGLDVALGGGDRLRLSPGMAVDGAGRVLLLPQDTEVGIADLLERSRSGGSPSTVAVAGAGGALFKECELREAPEVTEGLQDRELYLLLLSHAEAYCGEEEVYGRLCEEACATTTDRPYLVEGVLLRALPLALSGPLPSSHEVALDRRHLRSRVASAWFEQEWRSGGRLLSRSGLASSTWCRGAERAEPADVPLGVLAREGGTTLFLDAWTVRRERMDAPPRRYWAGRMAMRPWNDFLAQVLQFQCQLADLLSQGAASGGEGDSCAEERAALEETRRVLQGVTRLDAAGLRELLSAGHLDAFRHLDQTVARALAASASGPTERILLQGGIVELPPAGYLPVLPDSSVPVNRQVRRLLGEGVDLRFCSVRPDFPAHALEEAQHMERISLLQGLDDQGSRPEVDVLVPDGRIEARDPAARNLYDVSLEWRITGGVAATAVSGGAQKASGLETEDRILRLRGAARTEAGSGGATSLLGAAWRESADRQSVLMLLLALQALVQGESDEEAVDTGAGEAAPTDLNTAAFVRAAGGGSEPTGATRVSAAEARLARTLAVHERDVGLWWDLTYDADPAGLGVGDRLPCRAELIVGMGDEEQTVAARFTAEGDLVVQESGGSDPGRRTLRGRFLQIALMARAWAAGSPQPVVSRGLTVEAELDLGAAEGAGGPRDLRLHLEHESGVELAVRGVRTGDRAEGDLRMRRTVELDPPSSVSLAVLDAGGEGVTVRGTVRNLFDQSPLPGAQVTIPDRQVGAITNAQGEFSLTVSPDDGPARRVAITFVGMKAAETNLLLHPAGRQYQLDVRLAPTGGRSQSFSFRPAAFQAEETDAVLETDHPGRRGATASLDLIARGLGDPGFRAPRAKRLFAGTHREPEAVIHATRDWVLFHRRRRKECSASSIVPAPRPNRRYRVFHVELAEAGGDPELEKLLHHAAHVLDRGDAQQALEILNQVRGVRGEAPVSTTDMEELRRLLEEEHDHLQGGGVERLREALRSEDPSELEAFRITEVDTVAFRGDGVSLTSPTHRLLDGWRAVGPGSAVVYGALASREEAAGDGAVLAEGRLDRLQGAVEAETPAAPGAPLEVLPKVPPGLAATGAHGVAVLATVGEGAATVTHRVIAAEQGDGAETPGVLIRRITTEGLAGLEEAGTELHEIADAVRFSAGTADPLTDLDSAREEWEEVAGRLGAPVDVTVVLPPGTPEESAAPFIEQARAIRDALGLEARGDVTPMVAANESVFGGADAVTLLVPVRAH